MPDNAILVLDAQARTYIAPPCLTKEHYNQLIEDVVQERDDLRLSTAGEAYRLGYKPDPDCRDEDGFIQQGRSLTGLLFEALGLLRHLPGRWNPDGTWNW